MKTMALFPSCQFAYVKLWIVWRGLAWLGFASTHRIVCGSMPVSWIIETFHSHTQTHRVSIWIEKTADWKKNLKQHTLTRAHANKATNSVKYVSSWYCVCSLVGRLPMQLLLVCNANSSLLFLYFLASIKKVLPLLLLFSLIFFATFIIITCNILSRLPSHRPRIAILCNHRVGKFVSTTFWHRRLHFGSNFTAVFGIF